jgi:Tfp pilus tip-associated adhesin PilY1
MLCSRRQVDGIRRRKHMKTSKYPAGLALLIAFLIALPAVALANDEELFSSSSKANVLLLLDTTGSMGDPADNTVPALYDTSATGGRKMDALWKVVYTLLNANGSGATQGSAGKLGTATKTSGGGTSTSLVAGTSYNKITITGVSPSIADNTAILPDSDTTGTFVSVITGASSAGIKYTSKSRSGTTVTLNISGGQVFSTSVSFPAKSIIIYSADFTYPQSNYDATSAPYRNNLTYRDGDPITDEATLKANIGLITFDQTAGIRTRAYIYPTSAPAYLNIWDNVTNYAKPGGLTPAAQAVRQAISFFKTATNNNYYVCSKNIAILITDGADTVGGVAIVNGPLLGTGSGSSPDYGTSNAPAPDNPTMLRYNAVIQEAARLKNDPGSSVYSWGSLDPNAAPVDLYAIGLGISDNSPDSNVLREVLRRAALQQNAQMSLAQYRTAASNADNTSSITNRVYFATDIATLSDAITRAVWEATSTLYSFTAPTVASVRMTDRNYLYRASFCPRPRPVSFWEGSLQAYTLADNGSISASPLWDDNTILVGTLPSSRRIYTADNTTFSGNASGHWALRNFGTNSTGLNPSASGGAFNTGMLGVSSGIVDNVVNYVRGWRLDNNAAWQNTNTTKLGDIFHSKPVVVGPPSLFYFDTGYSSFAAANAARKRVLYVGTNDGMLHAFLSGVSVNGLYVADNTISGMGSELFGYVPNLLLSEVYKFLPGLASSDHEYYVDSSPRVADVWIDGYGGTAPTGAGTKNSLAWRTVLISGLRMGGSGYFALDVTDPGNGTASTDYSIYPKPLWEYTDPSNLGNSWSEPVIGKVRVQNSVGVTVDKWVAIFGGGWTIDNTVGKSLTVLDIGTGTPLKIFNDNTVFNNVIPASPTAVLDSTGFIRYIYVADLDGTVYKFNFVQTGVPGSGYSQWTVSKIFQASVGQSAYHRIEFSPINDSNRYLFFGTGNQDRPISDNVAGKFFGIVDSDAVVRTSPVTEAGLRDVTANLWAGLSTSTPTLLSPTDNGWFVNLSAVGPTGSLHTGEKVLSDPVVFYNNVYFTTYTYNPTVSVACSNSGIARVYGLSIYNASAALSALSSLGESPVSGKVPYHEYSGSQAGVAGGVASSPSLSINPAGQSSLFVGFSTGRIEQIDIPSPSGMKSIKSWKEIF